MSELLIKCSAVNIDYRSPNLRATIIDPDIPAMIEKIGEGSYDALLKELAHNLSPEDIFSTKQLDKWAEANDYIKNIED